MQVYSLIEDVRKAIKEKDLDVKGEKFSRAFLRIALLNKEGAKAYNRYTRLSSNIKSR